MKNEKNMKSIGSWSILYLWIFFQLKKNYQSIKWKLYLGLCDFKSTIIFHGLVYYVLKNLNDDILNSYLFHIPRWIDF